MSSDLAVAFQDRLVFRVQVDRDHLQLRQGGRSVGRCSRTRGTSFSERRTRRSMISPSGDSVMLTCLSSPPAVERRTESGGPG